MKANPNTFGELLGALFPGRDLLKPVATIVDILANQLPTAIEQGLVPICEMVDRLERLPPAPGYEPILVERGHHPLVARGLSYLVIRSGKEEANKAATHRIVADALRFLAKPGRTKRSISRKAAALLEAWNATSALSDAFHGSDISAFEFVEALEGAVRGELAARRKVTEVSAVLAPGLSVRRGPKVSEASMAQRGQHAGAQELYLQSD
jgi:hypothetical protein